MLNITNPYLEGTSAHMMFEYLSQIREEEYPIGDKGTIIFAREAMEVITKFLTDNAANICG